MSYESDFKILKNRTIKTATELCYNRYTIKLLEAAKTERELTQIMSNARQGVYDGLK